MKKALVFLVAFIALAVFLSGCPSAGAGGGNGNTDDEGALELADIFELLVNGSLDGDLSYDFGPVDPSTDGQTVSVTVRNSSANPQTLETASSSNLHFALQTPTLPFTLDADETADFSLTFDPTGPGEDSASITFDVEGFQQSLELTATGEGNYAPVAYPAVDVSGAGSSQANGTYIRTGTLNEHEIGGVVPLQYDIPRYDQDGGQHVIWGDTNGEGIDWYIDDDTERSDNQENYALYRRDSYTSWIAPSTVLQYQFFWETDWDGTDDPPTVVGELGANSAAYVRSGTSLSANYVYSDADGDSEGATSFQWYRADSPVQPASDREQISGATGASHTVRSGDAGSYLFVEVVPGAASGVAEGASVWLGPSPEVSN
jgi:hypothetical protein